MTAATLAAIAVAISTWGQPPCDVNVYWGQPTIRGATAEATVGGCEIVFDRREARRLRDRDWPMYCTVMVHEWGHVMGHEHSNNPRSVMAPELTKPFGGCNEQSLVFH